MAGDRYDVDTLQQALDRLGPALEILDGFTHRNKNQHRLSKWWAQLDMLRRGARKLSLCIQDSIRDRPPQGRKRKKQSAGGGRDENLAFRARHLRVQLVPRSYLAFTQLAADNQYAQLGLALLGVLAQIDQAASPLAARETTVAATGPEAGDSVEVARGAAGQAVPRVPEAADLGTAVSRADVARELDAGRPSGADGDLGVAVLQRASDELRRGEDGRHDTAGQGRNKGPAKSGKQKLDEFDELFGSLQPKSSSKRTKRKKRDEFDDMFSSLL